MQAVQGAAGLALADAPRAAAAVPAVLRRRDLDAARLLADQVRKREKLKKQELRLFQSEWAARMAGGRPGGAAGVLRYLFMLYWGACLGWGCVLPEHLLRYAAGGGAGPGCCRSDKAQCKG